MAIYTRKTLILHIRGDGAIKDVCENSPKMETPVILHACSATLDEVKHLKSKFPILYISISPLIHQRNDQGHRVRRLAREIPLEKLLIETDAPYMASKNKNYTLDTLVDIVKAIRDEKGHQQHGVRALIKQLRRNAQKAYQLD